MARIHAPENSKPFRRVGRPQFSLDNVHVLFYTLNEDHMSFDLFLQNFRRGEIATFPRAVVESAFKGYLKEVDPEFSILNFPDGGSSELYINKGAAISDFMIARPANSPELWQGLLDILRCTSGVLFWPGGGAVVANESVVQNLPESVIEAVGVPTVVHEPEEIPRLISEG